MLFLIGGASRSGKSILAEKLLQEEDIPRFSTDYLTSAFRSYPELGIRHEDNTYTRSESLWPFLKPMLQNIVEEEPTYCVEGEILTPAQVKELSDLYPGKITSAFLGYPTLTAEEKFQTIHQNHGHINDWLKNENDDVVMDVTSRGVEFSQFLQKECQNTSLGFFDTSTDFFGAINQAFAHLMPTSGR